MLDTAVLKRHKVSLADYEYKHDVENRLLMADFSTLDVTVLEEILFSSLNISVQKLAKTLEIKEEKLRTILRKLSKTGLLTLTQDLVTVDKEMRKYYESQIHKFEEEFCPGMEYLQSLLRHVPIHVLPGWYSIPRTSNNIFDSLIEKYLATPQIYARYLAEINFSEQVLAQVMHDVHKAPDCKMRADEIIEKYNLSREQFEEYLLLLEFHFACCLSYEKNGEDWEEVVTPFYEWREYQLFLRSTETPSIADSAKVVRRRPDDLGAVQDMGLILTQAKKQPISLSSGLSELAAKCKTKENDPYFEQLIAKLLQLKFLEKEANKLHMHDSAKEWLAMNLEHRGLHLYRHPLNRPLTTPLPASIVSDRSMREAEKSIERVVSSGWVYFDEFIKGVHVPLAPNSNVALKKTGKQWKYQLPSYTPEEISFIKATIFEILFEAGIVATGTHKGRDCFCVTTFGQSLFA